MTCFRTYKEAKEFTAEVQCNDFTFGWYTKIVRHNLISKDEIIQKRADYPAFDRTKKTHAIFQPWPCPDCLGKN